MSTPEPVDEAVWHVSAGHPTPDELAAVTAVLTAMSRQRGASSVRSNGTTNGWIAHWRRAGQLPAPAPDAWRRGVR